MKIAPRIIGTAFLAALIGLSAAAQTALEKELQASNDELVKLWTQKDWPGALGVLHRQLVLADKIGNPQIRAGVLYNTACVQALAGQTAPALLSVRQAVAAGYTEYDKYAYDSDLDSLRANPEFKALLTDLKAKYGPQALEWNKTRTVPAFVVTFDAPDAPEFAELRREFAIDAVVAGAKDDYERLRRLAAWTSTRWPHSSDQTASKTEPFTILREAQKGGRFICRDYAVVLAAAAGAYGMRSRLLNLLPRDVETRSEAHTAVEVWLEQFHKWVLADAQYGIVAELDGIPLNGVELQAAFAADRPVRCAVGAGNCAEWKPFILRNAYFFKYGDDQRSFQRKSDRQLVLVPKGASDPHKFAGGNEEVFSGSIYISNPEAFYAPPPKSR